MRLSNPATVPVAVAVIIGVLASPSKAALSPAASAETGIAVVAGSGERGVARDDVPASQTPMDNPTGVAVGPDGTVYVSDSGNHVVRSITRDGTVRTVAGTGRDGARAPEPKAGMKATDMPLAFPNDIAVGRDGTVFIADGGTIRVYALAPDGIISVRADESTGDGKLSSPMGAPSGLAVAPDGTLYIADRTNFQIIAVSPDGSVRVAAGGVGSAVTTAEGPATETPIGPVTGITVDAEGSLWISSAGNLLRVTGESLEPVAGDIGIVTTVSAGDDGIYLVDQPRRVIRRLTPDQRVDVVTTFADTQQPILWVAAAAAPQGPVYVVDNAANQVLAVHVDPIANDAPEPAPIRTWPYLASGMAVLILAILAMVWRVRRRQSPAHRETRDGVSHG